MAPNKSLSEMSGEFLREAGVLAVVFYPLEKVISKEWGMKYLFAVVAISCAMWIAGALIEIRRKS